jgi:hypothetical protein
MLRNSLVPDVSDRSADMQGPPTRGSGDARIVAEREPTHAELIEAIRAANLRARAIEGTEADHLVHAMRAAKRLSARAEALRAERLRRERRRRLWPFG